MDNQQPNYQFVSPQPWQQPPAPQPPQKKWYQKWWVWVIAGFLFLVIIIPKGGEEKPAAVSTPVPTVTVTTAPTAQPTITQAPTTQASESVKTYASFDTSSVSGLRAWFESAYEGRCDLYLDGADLGANMEGVFTMGSCNDADDGSTTMFMVLDPSMKALGDSFWEGFDEGDLGMPYTRGDDWVVASDKKFLVESLASGQGTRVYN